jgi:hypothetical protein
LQLLVYDGRTYPISETCTVTGYTYNGIVVIITIINFKNPVIICDTGADG